MQLVGGGARLRGGCRVDEIADRFSLWQVALAVEKRAERELARRGQPRPGTHGCADDAVQQQRIAVRADLGDVFTGVGMRRVEAQRYRVVVSFLPGGVHDQHARHARHPGRAGGAGHELMKDLVGTRSAQANHADGAAPGRRRHGDDGVVRSEHSSCRPRSAFYLRAMMTVFMKASPMLSDVTVGSSAIAMWTIRRS